jgi:hypothetical protein
MISKEIMSNVGDIVLFLVVASVSRASLILANPAIIIWGKGAMLAAIQAVVFFVFLFLGIHFGGEISVVWYAKLYSQSMILVLTATLFFLAIVGAKKYANSGS